MRSLHLSAALILGASVLSLALPSQDSPAVEARVRSLGEVIQPRGDDGTGKPDGPGKPDYNTGIDHPDGPGKPGDDSGIGKPDGQGKPGHETGTGNPTHPGDFHGKESRSYSNSGVGHPGGHGGPNGKGWPEGHVSHAKPYQKPGDAQHNEGKGPWRG